MRKELSLFERFLYEAPEDEAPDVAAAADASGPPDIPAEGSMDDGPPPDIPDDAGDGGGDAAGDDAPPDMGGGDDTFSDEGEFGADEGAEDDQGGENGEGSDKILGLDDKVSAIMNMNLYQRYLTLLSTIGNQITMIKNNSDILYTLSSDSLDIVQSLKRLDENIRLYMKNTFQNENYSKNLLFFNKCLNLLKLLNDTFDSNVRKGIRALK